MPTELQEQLRAYGRVLDLALPEEPKRRDGRARLLFAIAAVVALVVAVGAIVVTAAEDEGSDVILDNGEDTTVPMPEVIKRIARDRAPLPLAVSGGDVWLHESPHFLERRDARTGELLDVVAVQQSPVHGVAATDDVVYVAGGSDARVAPTTVSAVSTNSHEVLFKRTLPEVCDCAVAVGAGGLWLGGNGSAAVLRLDRQTGELVARIDLSAPARTIAVVDDRVWAGMQDVNELVAIDPATNAIEARRPVEYPDPAPDARVTAMADGVDSGWILRNDGVAFSLTEPFGLAVSAHFAFSPLAATDTDTGLWAVGRDRLGIWPHGDAASATWRYDSEAGAFMPDDGRASAASGSFRQIVAVGDTLWIASTEEVVVVRVFSSPG